MHPPPLIILIRLAIVLELVELLLKQGQTACNNNVSSGGGGGGSGSSSSSSSHSHHRNRYDHYNSASLAKILKSMPFQNCDGVP